MGMLDGLVGQIAKEALNQNTSQMSQGAFGDILGSVVASQMSGGNQGGDLGNVLGSVLGGGNQSAGGGLLGSVLGSALGGGQQSGGLGNILGSVLTGSGTQRGSGKGMLLAALMPMVLGWIQKKGGIGAALSELTGAGMQSQVSSWVSNEPNQSLPVDMIGKIFGAQEISQVATQTGADSNQVMEGLSSLLPEVINQLTPQGDMQSEQAANSEIGEVLSQLQGMLG